MDLEKMLKEIEKVLKDALEGVLGNVGEVEKALIKQIEAEIKKEISIRNGKILKNKDNLKAINKLRSSLDKYISGQIASKLKSFKPAFDEIGKVILENYGELASENALVLANLVKEQSIELVKEQFIAEGISAEVMPELSIILRNAAINGNSINSTIEAVQALVDSGLLPNAAKRITIDGLTTFSRSYVNALTADFDAKWYLYEGALRSTSRSFCESRAGKYYRKKEIESWARLDWQGKKAGTNSETIFLFAGGYNCYHLILPVPEAAVPEKYKN